MFTREALPLRWAMVNYNVGNVLVKLAAMDTGTERLAKAVKVYEGVGEVLQPTGPADRLASVKIKLRTVRREIRARELGRSALE